MTEVYCQDYQRSVLFAATNCSHPAKFVYTDLMGHKKLLCGKHARLYAKDRTVPITKSTTNPPTPSR